MTKFDFAAFVSAVAAVGMPTVYLIRKIIIKGFPFIERHFNDLLSKLDEVVETSMKNSETMENHLDNSEEWRESIEKRFEETNKFFAKRADLADKERQKIAELQIENMKTLEETICRANKLEERQRDQEDRLIDIEKLNLEMELKKLKGEK